MRFDGEWTDSGDGEVRPLVRGAALGADNRWHEVVFLVDSGADGTVFSADVLRKLRLPAEPKERRHSGTGGFFDTVVVQTQITLERDDGVRAYFRGEYAACTDPETLDMSVLGRDILRMFAVILDQADGVLCLIGGNHRYHIEFVS